LCGIKAAVDWRRGSTIGLYKDSNAPILLGPNVWDWFFEQPLVELDEVLDNPHDIWPQVYPYPIGMGEYMRKLNDLLTLGRIDVYNVSEMELLREIVPRLVKWSPSVQQYANILFKRYNLIPEETIAVSHRGTNKFNDLRINPGLKLVSIEDYFGILENLLIEHPTYKIWFQPEEQIIAEKMQKQFPQIIIMDEFYRVPPHAPIDMHIISDCVNPQSGYEKALKVITMMVMFSMASILVKNAGNLSDLAAIFSKGKIIKV
jgi:hypothetical protein